MIKAQVMKLFKKRYSITKLALNTVVTERGKSLRGRRFPGISLAQKEHKLLGLHVTQHQSNERVRLNAHPAQTVDSQQHRAWSEYRLSPSLVYTLRF